MQRLKAGRESNPVTSISVYSTGSEEKAACKNHWCRHLRPRLLYDGVDQRAQSALTLDPWLFTVRVSFEERSVTFTHFLKVDPVAYRVLMSHGRVTVGLDIHRRF